MFWSCCTYASKCISWHIEEKTNEDRLGLFGYVLMSLFKNHLRQVRVRVIGHPERIPSSVAIETADLEFNIPICLEITTKGTCIIFVGKVADGAGPSSCVKLTVNEPMMKCDIVIAKVVGRVWPSSYADFSSLSDTLSLSWHT